MTSQLYHMQTCTSAVVEQNKIILAENDFQNVLNNAIKRDEKNTIQTRNKYIHHVIYYYFDKKCTEVHINYNDKNKMQICNSTSFGYINH